MSMSTQELPKTKRSLLNLLRKTTDEAERSRIRQAIGQINHEQSVEADREAERNARHHAADLKERRDRYQDRKWVKG